MLRKLVILSVLTVSAGYTLEAAAIPPIKSQEAIGEEAESIKVEFRDNRPTGEATVKGCNRCPLILKIDEKTRFFAEGKPISREEAKSYSGNSGTIIFKHDRTIRIRW